MLKKINTINQIIGLKLLEDRIKAHGYVGVYCHGHNKKGTSETLETINFVFCIKPPNPFAI